MIIVNGKMMLEMSKLELLEEVVELNFCVVEVDFWVVEVDFWVLEVDFCVVDVEVDFCVVGVSQYLKHSMSELQLSVLHRQEWSNPSDSLSKSHPSSSPDSQRRSKIHTFPSCSVKKIQKNFEHRHSSYRNHVHVSTNSQF